ncbi:lysM domain receptor-like kinase 3 [Rhododendron vialii]|uniref:lysM domain receptor-like kinase 3 n=1 Tax=Rhododendron vialii TaxID=182163 RepID=UPI00265F7BA7|nr:lysM domain receptor-like kinase 3 [Rhododendron vialii]
MFRSKLVLSFSLSIIFLLLTTVQSKCPKTCDLALGSYYVWPGTNLTFISTASADSITDILGYNTYITNADSIEAGTRVNLPFTCDCIDDEFLGHVFPYSVLSGDTYYEIAQTYYANLTTPAMLEQFNSYPESNVPVKAVLNVTVNCSCGDAAVSKAYGLFITYPLRVGDSLESIAAAANLSTDLLQSYNTGVDFSAGSGLVYIPGKDKSGNYPPLKSSTGLSGGVIAGISLGVVMGALLVFVCIYCGFCRKKKMLDKLLSSKRYEDRHLQAGRAPGSTSEKSDSIGAPGSTSSRGLAISVDKSVEFSYEELAKATNDFSIGHKIGQGGFGAVYFAELRGEKAAIKKMDMMATREFLAELKVLTHVHHLNLVRLIGYCVEGSLFLVYEYIENGNLSQHLHGTGWDPIPWSTRVQIALDSARGLEYIHEHTVPVYIHRDIKTANILIDKNFRAKVADFGLTKLTEVGGSSLPTRLVGTFGYMPPEYAQYGDVSPKIDVYAFGVVLYELISAKEAIVKAGGSMLESKGLVALFEEVLNQPDPREDLSKLVDPRLGDSYPIDSVRKLAQLAKACTHENPLLRPSMRSAVVALMTLSSSTEDWDVGSFYENQALVSLMSGR